MITEHAENLTDQQAPAVNPAVEANKQEEYNKLFLFSDAKPRMQELKKQWDFEITETKRRRLLRNVDLSPAALRKEGKLLPDETLIPMRIIDTNIRREQPAYVNYLKGSGRLAVFTCVDDPSLDTQQLEKDFTRALSYPGWDTIEHKTLDGSQVHGWDSQELVFDESKPGHVAFEQIGHDKLFFATDSLDIQACELILRAYSFSKGQLKKAVVQHGFNPAQVQTLLDKIGGQGVNSSSNKDKDGNILLYKKLCKYDGVVYVAWFAFECDDWVKAPAPLFVGRKQQVTEMVPVETQGLDPLTGLPITIITQQPQTVWKDAFEVDYPVFVLPYAETEEQEIVAHKGRVFFDAPKQEAQTAIASGYVNGLVRASNLYGSVDQADPGDTAAPKQLDIKLQHAGIYNKPIKFWGPNYPDPTVLSGLQYFDVQNSQEVGQLNFAVMNRKDSRKTATENVMAQQQSTMLSSVQVSLYSTFLRNKYSYAWPIIQSRALAGLIKFLMSPVPQPNLQTGQIEMVWRNDMQKIGLQYDVQAAGDIDVIARGEILTRMKQDWPVIMNTPLAPTFLKEILKISYPQQSVKWIAELDNAMSTAQQTQNDISQLEGQQQATQQQATAA